MIVAAIPSRPARGPLRLDAAGAVLSAAGPVLLVLALGRGNEQGWASPLVAGLFAASAVCLGLFLVRERRAPDPLVDLGLFRAASFTGANAVTLLSTAVMCSLYFFLTLYLQQALGYTVLAAGASLLPLTLTIIVLSPAAGRAADLVGCRWPVAAGMLLLSAALLALALFRPGHSPWVLAAELALAGLGVALGRAPTASAAMAAAGEGSYGIAAGIFSTFQATGLALGIAVMGAVVGGYGGEAGLEGGFSAALTINAVIALAGAVLAAVTLRPVAPAPAVHRRPGAG